MKAAAIILLLAVCAVGSLSMTSCLVSRKSDNFACTTDSDCDPTSGRTCDRGYCVLQGTCPSPCTSCDLINKTCKIDCTSNKPCGSVQCPAGYDCTIRCSGTSACSNIDCAPGTGCNITCASGMAACGGINCGPGPCTVDCAGPASCGTVDCVTSCSCTVSCNNASSCPTNSCPPQAPGMYCTQDGTAASPCNPTASPVCDHCP